MPYKSSRRKIEDTQYDRRRRRSEEQKAMIRHLREINIDCVNREYDKDSFVDFFKSNDEIMQWIREVAMLYISRSEESPKQFIEETKHL